MTMTSDQCDELREKAKLLRGYVDGLSAPYVIPSTKELMALTMLDSAGRMEQAADTILELRDDLQRANDAVRDAEHDESMAWDRVRKAEAENAKLRERVEQLIALLHNDWDIDASWDGLRRFWSIGLTEDGCLMRDRICKAEAENAKLVDVLHEVEAEAVHAYRYLQQDCVTTTNSSQHFFDKWWHAECELDRLKAENDKLLKILRSLMMGTNAELCAGRDRSDCKECSMYHGKYECTIVDAIELLGIDMYGKPLRIEVEE